MCAADGCLTPYQHQYQYSQAFNTESWPGTLPLRITHSLRVKSFSESKRLNESSFSTWESDVDTPAVFIAETEENFFPFLACLDHASLHFHYLALNKHKHNTN